MMRAVTVATPSDARFFQRVVCVAMGYPRRARADCGGIHAPVERKPADLGARNIPGSTTRYADWIEHPTDPTQQAHPVDARLLKCLVRERARLSASEQVRLDAILATDGEIDVTWETELDDGEGGTLRVLKPAPDVRPDDVAKLRRR